MIFLSSKKRSDTNGYPRKGCCSLRLACICVLSIVSMSVSAQTFIVSGNVSDAQERNSPLPLAKVELFAHDSTFLTRGLTANNGSFRLETKRSGSCLLKVSFTGYETIWKSITVSKKKPKVHVGTLLMALSEKMLDAAQVSGVSSQLTIKADTFVYNVAAFRVPPGASLSALVKQLPGLEMDDKGTVTYQGKVVEEILINGKELFSDTQTALANIPVEVLQDVKAYEKKSEEAEFKGKVDPNKKTVLDLTIKKEYRATWMATLDGGAGNHNKYMGKAFVTRFTDRLRLTLYGNLNNVSEDQRVDENGNWTTNVFSAGLNTYRKGGLMASWDNGRKLKEKGRVELKGSTEFTYNNTMGESTYISEDLLPGGNSQSSYGRQRSNGHYLNAQGNGRLNWTIDSMNRISASASYSYGEYKTKYLFMNAVYNRPQLGNPLEQIFAPSLSDSIRQMAVYSMQSYQNLQQRYIYINSSVIYIHRFAKEGRNINASIGHKGNYGRNNFNYLTQYRYFQPNAPRPELLTRQYEYKPSNNDQFYIGLRYEDKLSKHLHYNLIYNYAYMRDQGDRLLYQLDSLSNYANMDLPLGARPSTADSLEAVRNEKNSHFSTQLQNYHSLGFEMSGQWDKAEFVVGASGQYRNDRLYYQREGVEHRPVRNSYALYPWMYGTWKFSKVSKLTFRYSGTQLRPEMLMLVPVIDDSNPMNVFINNTKLKNSWENAYSLRMNVYNKKSGLDFSGSLSANTIDNEMINTLTIDPVTGVRYNNKVNVNGNYRLNASTYFSLPLDSARRWNVNGNLSCGYRHSQTYLGDIGNEDGISVMNSTNINAYGILSYRKKIWSFSLFAGYWVDFSRYKEAPTQNQNASSINCTLTGMVDLPSGFSISTNFGPYKLFNYIDEQMNTTQYLWNAKVSQTFLKSKALTVQLEFVDILQDRSFMYGTTTAQRRYSSNSKAFASYSMLHLIYRLNLGRKKG